MQDARLAEGVEKGSVGLGHLIATKLDESFGAAARGEFVTEEDLDDTLQSWRGRMMDQHSGSRT
jgi:hypothetical protein